MPCSTLNAVMAASTSAIFLALRKELLGEFCPCLKQRGDAYVHRRRSINHIRNVDSAPFFQRLLHEFPTRALLEDVRQGAGRAHRGHLSQRTKQLRHRRRRGLVGSRWNPSAIPCCGHRRQNHLAREPALTAGSLLRMVRTLTTSHRGLRLERYSRCAPFGLPPMYVREYYLRPIAACQSSLSGLQVHAQNHLGRAADRRRCQRPAGDSDGAERPVAVMVTPPAAAHGPGLPASASGMGGRRLVPQCHCASGPAGRTVPRDRTGHPSPSRDNGPRPRLCRMMTLRWARPYEQAALSPLDASIAEWA